MKRLKLIFAILLFLTGTAIAQSTAPKTPREKRLSTKSQVIDKRQQSIEQQNRPLKVQERRLNRKEARTNRKLTRINRRKRN